MREGDQQRFDSHAELEHGRTTRHRPRHRALSQAVAALARRADHRGGVGHLAGAEPDHESGLLRRRGDARHAVPVCAVRAAGRLRVHPACRPARPRERDGVPWYDAALFAANVAVFAYFAFNAHRIISEGWEFAAPEQAVWVAYVGWLVLLEATRRAGGTAVFLVVTFFSLYPVIAGHMPGPISGLPQPLSTTAAYHFASSEACSAFRRAPSANWSSASSCSARCCSTPARRISSTTSPSRCSAACAAGRRRCRSSPAD